MKKRQMAVCDEEPDYTRQFARYANRDREPLFLVHGYTDVQELIRDTKEHPADIILLSPKYAEDFKKQEPTGQIICLTEEEYQEGLKGLADQYGAESPEAFEEQYGRETVEAGLIFDKTVDFVVEQAVEL